MKILRVPSGIRVRVRVRVRVTSSFGHGQYGSGLLLGAWYSHSIERTVEARHRPALGYVG